MNYITFLKFCGRIGLLFLGVALLLACTGETERAQPQSSPSPNPMPVITVTNTPSPLSHQELRRGLRIWLPPQFDPNSEQQTARLLSDRLQAFYEQFPNLPIEVRLKAEEGPGGMLEALTAASEAAPLALPDLVLLPRELVAPLAQQGILHSLDGYVQLSEDQKWYPYARQLVTVENMPFGIPFIGDVLLLAYPQNIASELPLDWNDWLISRYTLGFPAADPRATVMLALYLQAGGSLRNAQGRPILEENVLTELLDNLSYAHRQGKFPAWVIQAETDQPVLQALTEGKIDSGYLWGSSYLKGNSQTWRATAGFLAKKTSLTLADGWIWACTTPIPDQIGISFQLASFLSEAQFMSSFTQTGGYLPTRADAFFTWEQNQIVKDLDTISNLAQVIPPSSLSDPLGIALRNAALAVIKDRIPPQQAANDAIASLNKP
ncbi:MAG: extracellular solute-binding protein [Anaerolineales bacterium]|nr:extracellular solute-binding protein [Anaerolineales bacterium]